MKRILFSVVLLAVVLQTTATGVIYLQFLVNRSYIAKNLCVKKEVKNNCCQGSCQLTKQLKEEEKKEKSPVSPNIKIETTAHLFCQSFERFYLLPAPLTGQVFNRYPLPLGTDAVRSVFHPPAFTA